MKIQQVKEMLERAYRVASVSKDSSSQNGAVIVADGFTPVDAANNFPRGVEFTEARASQRPDKYRYFEHAERGAVYEAARMHVDTEGATMVCPWAACCDCARAIICAGINCLVVHESRMRLTPERWQEDVDAAFKMLDEAGVQVHRHIGPINARPILANGRKWCPFTCEFLELEGDTSHLGMGK